MNDRNSTPKNCTVDGCVKKDNGGGLCSMHYARRKRANTTALCSVEGCDKLVRSLGWCRSHYQHYLDHGNPLKGPFFKPIPIVIGQRFTRLVVVSDPYRVGIALHCRCRCDCGVETTATKGNLVSGRHKSCGCLREESILASNVTHGQSKTSIYNIWSGMIQRCTNPNNCGYRDYGARGIRICERWYTFKFFADDMGERPPGMWIERIDNNKGYEPGNCRWATVKEQCRNRRSSLFLAHDGETRTLAEWSEITGMPTGTIQSRIRSGWAIDRVLSEPRRVKRVDQGAVND